MRIRKVSSATPGAPRRQRHGPAPQRDSAWQHALGRAVAQTAQTAQAAPRHPVRDPGEADAGRVRPRHYLPFIAQLAAGRIGLPQTRARRRASKDDARSFYAAADLLSTVKVLGTRRMRAI